MSLRSRSSTLTRTFAISLASIKSPLALTIAAGAATTLAYAIYKSRSRSQDQIIPRDVRNESEITRFRADNDSSATITLSDGRRLGYAEYGLLTGKPVLYFHGLPGCRLEGAGFTQLAKEAGLRLICVDRPGIGWSDPKPGRKLIDYPNDIQELATHLSLGRYGILGISGGGPPALACAYQLPADELACVSIVVGMGPPDIGMRGADFMHVIGFPYGYRIAPRWSLRRFWQMEQRLDLTDEQRVSRMLDSPVNHEKDLAFLRTDWPRLSARVSREAFSQGFDGVIDDGILICRDFGFALDDIRKTLTVQLWYGKHDVYVPPNHGIQIAKRVGSKAQLHLEDETHGSMVANKMANILADLEKAI